MRTLRKNRRPLGLVLSALLLVWQIQQPLAGATLIWDSDTLTSGRARWCWHLDGRRSGILERHGKCGHDE